MPVLSHRHSGSRRWIWALVVAGLLSACASTAPTYPGEDPGDPMAAWQHDRSPSDERAAPSAGAAPDLVLHALAFLDVDYRHGGSSAETGFDCSGFVRHVVEQARGIVLPRRAEEQARATQTIRRADLRPGDLVFFNTLRRPYSHVGIYLGDGRFVHAPRTGAQVRVERMEVAYWASRFDGARRVPGPDALALR